MRGIPSPAYAFDQPLRQDGEVWKTGGEASGSIRAVPATGRQDGHVPLEVLHDGKAVRVAHQDLEDCHLEVHATRP